MVNSVFGDVFNINSNTEIFSIANNISVFAFEPIIVNIPQLLEKTSYSIYATGVIIIPLIDPNGCNNRNYTIVVDSNNNYLDGVIKEENINEINNRPFYRFEY